MNPFALTMAALLLSSLPLLAQESETERLKKEVAKLKADIAALEERQVEMARQKKLLEDKFLSATAPAPVPDEGKRDVKAALAALEAVRVAEDRAKAAAYGRNTYLAFKVITGKVTAVADEIGLVVLSVGGDDGVREGGEFTVYRGGDFVAKVVVDRVDRKWSAAKIVLKKQDPRVADQVSNAVSVSPPKAEAVPMGPKAGAELLALRKELDEVRNQVRQLTDRLVPSYQGPGVSVEEAPEPLREHLGILRGLLVRRVREGSPAEKAGLKANDVIPDLLEAQLVEALESGMPIHIVRQGAKLRLPGAKGR